MKISTSSFRYTAFTLVEVLVSLTVLSLIVFLVANITHSASTTVGKGAQRVDADNQARSVFARIANDFAAMVKREDVDFFFKSPIDEQGLPSEPGVNDQFAFFANLPGSFASLPSSTQIATHSLVAYKLATASSFFQGKVMQRLAMGMEWGQMPYLPIKITGSTDSRYPNLLPPSSSPDAATGFDALYQVFGDQVFRMEYTYLLKPTKTLPAKLSIVPSRDANDFTSSTQDYHGLRDVAAIVVGIAIVDTPNRNKITNYNKLIELFPNADEEQDIISRWLPVVNQTEFADKAGIPKASANAVRVYQRYFFLDTK